MDKKTVGIIATIATVLLCGCPGLISLCSGLMFALVGIVPGSDIDMMGSSDPASAIAFGFGGICAGVIFIAIPIVVGIVTLRKPKTAVVGTANADEPLPPAL
jgi:hypothetical protein